MSADSFLAAAFSSIDMYKNDVGKESAQKIMKQTGDLRTGCIFAVRCADLCGLVAFARCAALRGRCICAVRAGCSCKRRRCHAFDGEGGLFGIGSTLIDAHTLSGQAEGGRVGLRWLSRFKLIRLRRISFATFAAFGGAHNE